DGNIVMRPVKVVPVSATARETQAPYGPPAQTAAATAPATREWADANATRIEQYNAWAAQREPYSQRVRRWRDNGPGNV
ncbi:hypothetical protein, partial [Hydrogenophaga sp.]|uniref:hypothetical protein n=1 Tax=Hydrogenophaga sp. TaxID=1904254 RepID=UPI002ABB5C4D